MNSTRHPTLFPGRTATDDELVASLVELGLAAAHAWSAEEPFLTRLAETTDGGTSPESITGTARHLVFRVLHRLVTDPASVTTEDLRATRGYVDELPAHSSERPFLRDLLVYVDLPLEWWEPVFPIGCVTYAEHLERLGFYPEALAFMGLACRSYHEGMPRRLFVLTALTVARLRRRLADWIGAELAYRKAEGSAERLGDSAARLRALNGRIMVLAGRGDLPAASALAERSIGEATDPALTPVVAVTYQMLAAVRERQGRIVEAACALYTAFRLQPDTQERLHVLGDLGACLARAGQLVGARYALELVHRHSQLWLTRTNAAIELMALEAASGAELAFWGLARELGAQQGQMPPSMAVDFLVQLATGLQRFDYGERARQVLLDARAHAEHHRLPQWVFRVEDQLRAGSNVADLAAPRPEESGPGLAAVVEGLRSLAECR